MDSASSRVKRRTFAGLPVALDFARDAIVNFEAFRAIRCDPPNELLSEWRYVRFALRDELAGGGKCAPCVPERGAFPRVRIAGVVRVPQRLPRAVDA